MFIVEKVIIGTIIAIIGVVGIMSWNESHSEHYQLNKDNWKCSQYKTETVFIHQNNTMIPIINSVCVEYRRINS